MRVSGVKTSLTYGNSVDANGCGHSALEAAAELALENAKAARNVDAQIACIDLLDVIHGRALAARPTQERIAWHLGVRVPIGRFNGAIKAA